MRSKYLQDGPILPVQVHILAVLFAQALEGHVDRERGEGQTGVHDVVVPKAVDRHICAETVGPRFVLLRPGCAQGHRNFEIGRII